MTISNIYFYSFLILKKKTKQNQFFQKFMFFLNFLFVFPNYKISTENFKE